MANFEMPQNLEDTYLLKCKVVKVPFSAYLFKGVLFCEYIYFSIVVYQKKT